MRQDVWFAGTRAASVFSDHLVVQLEQSIESVCVVLCSYSNFRTE